ncbi:outer membrane protein assembly factor BamB [Undibacterium sp.]|jgi:outer membrane protein assembly factor BamB|uniref:outer membrane protein assembly factor BamB n=1 Tax=Undibacterium sp. TaxID=1914977 RepID=UPI002C8B08B9|nr:outer membrane protein assembly factor BamB [Undibacterium sp.]HTD02373.1 outer membrane protein assembly factor BamB [Undibacterium sp.]
MHFSAKIVGIAALLAVTGCSTISKYNPFSSKTESKHPPAALQEFKPSMAIKQAWSASVGNAGVYVFTPAQVGEFVYAAGADGTVAKLEASNGRSAWRINAGMPLTAGVGADANTIAVAGQKGFVLAFDNDGKLRWKVQASSEILSAPAVGQGLVIVRSIDNKIAAYDIESGTRKWTVDRPLPTLILRTVPGITIADQLVIVALPGGRLAALSINNGGLRWEIAAGDPKGATELERIADVSGTPIVMGREVCTVAYQGRVGCYDLVSGAVRWAKNLSSDVGVSVDERFVFAADDQGAVSAFSRAAGASAWKNDKLAHRRLSTPTSFGRAVAVGDSFGYVHFLSREDGSFIGRINTDGSQIVSAPLVAGSNLIVQTKSGAVVALAAE